jgi:hypothetical protein
MLVPSPNPPTTDEIAAVLAGARRELTDCLLLAIGDTVNVAELLSRIDQQIVDLTLLDNVTTATGTEGDAKALAAEFALLRQRIRPA